MPNTANLGLPLVEPSQAQKHVTVNEALLGVDALGQLVLTSLSETVPPVSPPDGAVYAVPAGASGAWTNFAGQLATHVNGGWVFHVPRIGWRAWSLADDADVVFDGFGWRIIGQGAAPSGAATVFTPVEFSHVVSPGSANVTGAIIPAGCVVMAVTGRVTSGITGSLVSWRLGVAGSDDRYGSGLGIARNSYARGLTGTPMAYYADTPLEMTAEGGVFSGGEVTLVLHVMRFDLPDPV